MVDGLETINIQFVLNDEMHQFFAPLPEDHNKRTVLSKETKAAVKRTFGGYASIIHEMSLVSILPYVT